MEVNITWFFTTCADPMQYSASVAEYGDRVVQLTWHNALEKVMRAPLLTTEAELKAARDYFKETGAWSREEVRSWSGDEVQALLTQEIASQMRECVIGAYSTGEDWERYEEEARTGRVPSNIFRGDDGLIYFDL